MIWDERDEKTSDAAERCCGRWEWLEGAKREGFEGRAAWFVPNAFPRSALLIRGEINMQPARRIWISTERVPGPEISVPGRRGG